MWTIVGAVLVGSLIGIASGIGLAYLGLMFARDIGETF
jgi:hypothetical protein